MQTKQIFFLCSIQIVVITLFSSFLHAETLIHCPLQDQSLSQKWDWAHTEARNQNLVHGYWVGYSIQRQMGEQEYYITGTRIHFDGMRSRERPSLSEVILGIKETTEPSAEPDDQKVRRLAKEALAGLEHSNRGAGKVARDLAILLGFRSPQATGPTDFAMLNMSLPFDFEKRPLIWLGKAEEGQSLSLLIQLYRGSGPDNMKEDLLGSISSHPNTSVVLPFLRQVVASDASNSTRSAAALAIGSHGSEEAIPILLQICRNDRSSEVREGALVGLGEISSPGARAAILELVKTGNTRQLRESALYQLAEDASPQEIAEIKGILMNDPDQEIQEAALYAIAELDDSVPLLIQVARTHAKTSLREAALYALAENGNREAIATLQQIALKDSNEELQEAALYALTDLDHEEGIPFVVEIARHHQNRDMRIRAIEALGDSDSPKAKDALISLLEN